MAFSSVGVDINFYIAILCFMRFLSLFLICSIMVCYSGGVCSAVVLVAEESEQTSTHCEMMNHSEAYTSEASQVLIQSAEPTDSSNSLCCYEALTNSSLDDNIGNSVQEVLYILDLPTSLNHRNSKSTDLIITRSAHDPPDIYIYVSRFLL